MTMDLYKWILLVLTRLAIVLSLAAVIVVLMLVVRLAWGAL